MGRVFLDQVTDDNDFCPRRRRAIVCPSEHAVEADVQRILDGAACGIASESERVSARAFFGAFANDNCAATSARGMQELKTSLCSGIENYGLEPREGADFIFGFEAGCAPNLGVAPTGEGHEVKRECFTA